MVVGEVRPNVTSLIMESQWLNRPQVLLGVSPIPSTGQSWWVQIKNIKLHIVTDIKVTFNSMFGFRISIFGWGEGFSYYTMKRHFLHGAWRRPSPALLHEGACNDRPGHSELIPDLTSIWHHVLTSDCSDQLGHTTRIHWHGGVFFAIQHFKGTDKKYQTTYSHWY